MLFIEGVIKEPNWQVRAECATGLGRIGVTAFRTLLLALNDCEQSVRDAAASAILRNMSPEDVQTEFMPKTH